MGIFRFTPSEMFKGLGIWQSNLSPSNVYPLWTLPIMGTAPLVLKSLYKCWAKDVPQTILCRLPFKYSKHRNKTYTIEFVFKNAKICYLNCLADFLLTKFDNMVNMVALGNTYSQLFIYIWYFMCYVKKNFEVRTFLCGLCSGTVQMITWPIKTLDYVNNTWWESFPNLYMQIYMPSPLKTQFQSTVLYIYKLIYTLAIK